MLRFTCLIFLALASYANAQGGVIIYGGDPIGADSSTTDGLGASAASNGSNSWIWEDNLGQPAFEYISDGKATLRNLRAIIAVIPRTTNGVKWQNQDWTVDVWEKNAYLNQGQPIVTKHLGNTPDNWSGFKDVLALGRVPDTAVFGDFGTTASVEKNTYELIFDLANHTAFQEALPAGEYIIGFQARTNPDFSGEALIGLSVNGQGPEHYFSTVLGNVLPQPIFPGLTPNPNAHFGLSLEIESNLENGSFNASEFWSPSGSGAVNFIEANENMLAEFTTGSEVTLSQNVISNSESFTLAFDHKFGQAAGVLEVFFDGELLASLDGTTSYSAAPDTFSAYSITIDDPSIFSRRGDLEFKVSGSTGTTFQLDNVVFGSVPEPNRGDVNLDGAVNFGDIPAFIMVLQSGVFQAEADVDLSGTVDFDDIPAFITVLQGQ